MTRSTYKRKKKWEELDNYTKLVSKNNRHRHLSDKRTTKLFKRIKIRKAQQTKDHNFLAIIKEKYPKEFELCLEEHLETKGLNTTTTTN